VRPAAARKPRASRSARVIAIVMSNPPAQEAVIQTRHILATHVRVSKTGRWYQITKWDVDAAYISHTRVGYRMTVVSSWGCLCLKTSVDVVGS